MQLDCTCREAREGAVPAATAVCRKGTPCTRTTAARQLAPESGAATEAVSFGEDL